MTRRNRKKMNQENEQNVQNPTQDSAFLEGLIDTNDPENNVDNNNNNNDDAKTNINTDDGNNSAHNNDSSSNNNNNNSNGNDKLDVEFVEKFLGDVMKIHRHGKAFLTWNSEKENLTKQYLQ